ncbi:MAG TPA: PAS domain S-box protein [Azospirillaceae bacterium]|nr:PAS domain S-box protein [Azospirillaceae bacterium]
MMPLSPPPIADPPSLGDERYRIVSDLCPDALLVNAGGRIAYINAAGLRLLGAETVEQVLGRPVTALVPPECWPGIAARIERVMAEGAAPPAEQVWCRLDGSTVEVEASAARVPWKDGYAVQVLARDISGRRRIEEALRASERRLQAVLNNATVAILHMDESLHCVYMNAAAERLTGYTLDDMRGRTLHEVVHHSHPDGSPYPAKDCPINMAFPTRNRIQGEEIFVHRDGTFFPVAYTASPIEGEGGDIVGTIIEIRSLAEEKRRDAAQRLLMREVDHRAKNALAVVQALVQLSRADTIEGFKQAVEGRVAAMARAHSLLASNRWTGGDLSRLLAQELAPFQDRCSLSGPPAVLGPDDVQPVAMALHELVTNAAKYGALSTPGGRVAVGWTLEPSRRRLTLVWAETGGPEVRPPTRRGFGSTLLDQGICAQVGGSVRMEWLPEGLRCTLELPVTATGA